MAGFVVTIVIGIFAVFTFGMFCDLLIMMMDQTSTIDRKKARNLPRGQQKEGVKRERRIFRYCREFRLSHLWPGTAKCPTPESYLIHFDLSPL